MSPETTPAKDSNTLAQNRTKMSEHRTHLSEHRTQMSDERTGWANLRSHLANERTHLAYLRTGISLITFGITLNRFSLALQQSNIMPRHGGRTILQDSQDIGIGMVIIGSLLLLWSVLQFYRIGRAIDHLSYRPAKWSILIFTALIICTGVASAIWMIAG